MKFIEAPSPNFGPRAEGKKIKYLVLHYTGTKTALEAQNLLQGSRPDHKVSSHYLVDEAGTVTRLVDESMRAQHAGIASWDGETDINSCSIGIEIQNPGHEHGYVDFPDVQMKVVAELCLEIIKRYDIQPQDVIGHSDVAPARKQDPGEKFPWEWLAQQGIGLWPSKTDIDNAAVPKDIKPLLVEYGYDSRIDDKTLITAFQRHFEPKIFATPEKVGISNPTTGKTAEALVKKKLVNRPKIS